MAKANYRVYAKMELVPADGENDAVVSNIEINMTSKKVAIDAKEQLTKAGWTTKVEMTKELE